jgi:NADPH:quinone reductase-like Zn-dependent oxidoreductase
VGKNVKDFAVGDSVFGSGVPTFQCHAEYKCLPENSVILKKPVNINFEEAASISFGWLTAMHFIKLAKVGNNSSVLIVGASGAVGSAAVQLCKQLGWLWNIRFSSIIII